jgi:hypothetical protein
MVILIYKCYYFVYWQHFYTGTFLPVAVKDSRQVLKDWIIGYLKARDAVAKQIVSIAENADGADIVIDCILKKQFVIVQQILSDPCALAAFQDRHIVLVTANTRANLEFLISNWDSFVRFQHLSIYFVNPDSGLEKRWVIYPATHNCLFEKNALRKGLESIFSSVEEWKLLK